MLYIISFQDQKYVGSPFGPSPLGEPEDRIEVSSCRLDEWLARKKFNEWYDKQKANFPGASWRVVTRIYSVTPSEDGVLTDADMIRINGERID